MRILMLGNSFTYFNDMPDMLAQILDAEVVHHTRGGAHLSEHLDPETELGAKTQAALQNEKWDYVITVCDNAYETCPVFQGEVKNHMHIGFDDPSHATGTPEFIDSEYHRVRDEIGARMYALYQFMLTEQNKD